MTAAKNVNDVLFSQKLTVSRFMGPGITRPTSESGQVKPAEHRVCRVEGS